MEEVEIGSKRNLRKVLPACYGPSEGAAGDAALLAHGRQLATHGRLQYLFHCRDRESDHNECAS